MNSDRILAHAEDRARQSQAKVAELLARLEKCRVSLVREAYDSIFGEETGPHTFADARAFFDAHAGDEGVSRRAAEIAECNAVIDEARILALAGGVTAEEQAVILESLSLADDFEGLARNALNQICVFVRAVPGAGLRALGLTFAVTEETAAVERAVCAKAATFLAA